jgi:hypothetical protein
MSQRFSTCRFCGESSYNTSEMVKYGTRHYAHHRCYLDAGKPLDDLPDWKIVSFPYRLLEERGLTCVAYEANRRLAERENS